MSNLSFIPMPAFQPLCPLPECLSVRLFDEIYPFIGGCEVAEYGMAGTDDLAQKAVKALGNNYAAS